MANLYPIPIGNASSSNSVLYALYGKNGQYTVNISIDFETIRDSEDYPYITCSIRGVRSKVQSSVDLGANAEIIAYIAYNKTASSTSYDNRFYIKRTGSVWNINDSIDQHTDSFNFPTTGIYNANEPLYVSICLQTNNEVLDFSHNTEYTATFTVPDRIPPYVEPTGPLTGTLTINSPSDGAKYTPNSIFYLSWSGVSSGINNPISEYNIYRNNTLYTSTTNTYSYCPTPLSNNSDTWYVEAVDTEGLGNITSSMITVSAYEGEEPSLSLSSSSTTYGTSGGTLTLNAYYSGGYNFDNGFINLPSGVTYNGSNSIIVPPGGGTYNITIGQNISSFSLIMYANNYEAGSSWQASSSPLNFTLVRVAPNISSISVIPSYTNDGTLVELYNTEKLGRIFDIDAIIYGQGTTPLICNTSWYIAHSLNKTTVSNASYNTSNVSENLTSNLSNSNINVSSIVSGGEYFKFILYAENDGQIRTQNSEIFYFPFAPIMPSNFKCTNIKGENATINNSTALTITTEANFTWTLNNRSSSNNNRLSYKSIRLEYSSKNNAGGVYSNWSTYGTYSTTTTFTEKNTDNLTKGYFYGFRIIAEDLEGVTSTNSDYINTFRSLGPSISEPDINFDISYNDFTAYKPLSKIENNYYNVSISNNKGNLENDGLTYKVYGRYGAQDTLLFTYTCTESTTDDKGFILNGSNITFGGNNDTVIANLSGQIIKDYITSRNITDKNARYTNFSFYITIEDGYGETVSFNQPFNVDYREAPTWPAGINFPIGINYNINNSTAYEKMLITTSSSNDRMINFKEKIRFKFPVMEDLNRTESNLIDNDVNKYRISVARLNVKPNENPGLDPGSGSAYSQYSFSLLKEVAKSSLTSKQAINGKNYYIYDFEFPQYTVNYFLVFKLEGIDTKGLVSTPIYSNTYLVGCRVQPPIVNLTSLEADTIVNNEKTYFNNLTLSCNIIDNGGSKFNNSSYDYSTYNNLERTIKGDDDYKINLTLHISKTPDFSEYGIKSIDLTTYAGTYKPYSSLNLNTIEFNISDLLIERTDQMKLYVRAILDYPLGYTDVLNGTFYNISSEATLANISQTLTYFTEAPTVSYRKNRIGINTNTFEDNDLVTIVESTGRNIIRIVGSNEAGTEKFTITLNLKTKEIDGIIIDGGSW